MGTTAENEIHQLRSENSKNFIQDLNRERAIICVISNCLQYIGGNELRYNVDQIHGDDERNMAVLWPFMVINFNYDRFDKDNASNFFPRKYHRKKHSILSWQEWNRTK